MIVFVTESVAQAPLTTDQTEAVQQKHLGPGPHPSGSDQDVHAGGAGGSTVAPPKHLEDWLDDEGVYRIEGDDDEFDGLIRYGFEVDGRKFKVKFKEYTSGGGWTSALNHEKYLEMEFSDDSGRYRITGRGNAMQVFRKASAILFNVARERQPSAISFESVEYRSSSRADLYDFFAQRVKKMGVGYTGARIRRSDTSDGVGKWALFRNDLVDEAEETNSYIEEFYKHMGPDDHPSGSPQQAHAGASKQNAIAMMEEVQERTFTGFPPFMMLGLRQVESGEEATIVLEASVFDRAFHLSFIGVAKEDRGKGFGTSAMNWLTDIADKHSAVMHLNVDPQTMQGDDTPPMDSAALENWYQKFGFQRDDHGGMIRPPSIEKGIGDQLVELFTRHLGPGPHPSGSDQDVHAGDGDELLFEGEHKPEHKPPKHLADWLNDEGIIDITDDIDRERGSLSYTFKVGERSFIVEFESYRGMSGFSDATGEPYYDMTFQDDSGSMSITGKGEAMKVFRKTAASMFQMIRETKPAAITFTAIEATSSRADLYEFMARRMRKMGMGYTGGVVERSSSGRYGEFAVFRNDLLNAADDVAQELFKSFKHMGPGDHPSGSPQAVHAGGGIESVSSLEDAENQIRNKKLEHCFVFNKDGEIVLYKKGNENSIRFSDEETALMKDTVFTHNHPNGIGFSKADIAFAAYADMSEIRAVGELNGKQVWYSWKRPVGGWPTKSNLAITVSNASSSVFRQNWSDIQDGKITKQEAEERHQHMMSKEIVRLLKAEEFDPPTYRSNRDD